LKHFKFYSKISPSRNKKPLKLDFKFKLCFFCSESSSCKEKEQRESGPESKPKGQNLKWVTKCHKTIEWELPFLARI
jgi:hypothetical protein